MHNCQEDLFHLGMKALLQEPNGNFLLLKKKTRNGFFWDLPGGRLQKGESYKEALLRELLEEVGEITLGEITPLLTFPIEVRIPTSWGDVGLILSVYLSKLPYSLTPILSSEHEDFHWFSYEELFSLFEKKYPRALFEALESQMSPNG